MAPDLHHNFLWTQVARRYNRKLPAWVPSDLDCLHSHLESLGARVARASLAHGEHQIERSLPVERVPLPGLLLVHDGLYGVQCRPTRQVLTRLVLPRLHWGNTGRKCHCANP